MPFPLINIDRLFLPFNLSIPTIANVEDLGKGLVVELTHFHA